MMTFDLRFKSHTFPSFQSFLNQISGIVKYQLFMKMKQSNKGTFYGDKKLYAHFINILQTSTKTIGEPSKKLTLLRTRLQKK